jgi:hypothetical protein
MSNSNIGVGSDNMQMRTSYDAKMLSKYNPVRENFVYTDSNIGVLASTSKYEPRTLHDLEMNQRFGCRLIKNEQKENYCGPCSNCSCGSTTKANACPFARTTDNPFNPWSSRASYVSLQ